MSIEAKVSFQSNFILGKQMQSLYCILTTTIFTPGVSALESLLTWASPCTALLTAVLLLPPSLARPLPHAAQGRLSSCINTWRSSKCQYWIASLREVLVLLVYPCTTVGGDITAPLLHSNFAAQKHIKVPVFFVSVLSELKQSHTRKPGMVSF